MTAFGIAAAKVRWAAPPLMFRPSPCPRHYAGRWATMPSADFCLITVKIAPRRAAVCHPVRSLLADDMPERPDLFYTRACTGSRRPLVKQISPNKNMNCHCTTPSFTVSREPLDFVTLCPLIPETQPCMTFLSVGSQFCASASFPPALAGWQLPSASSYAALKARTVGSPTGDLHPMSSCPCRAYTSVSTTDAVTAHDFAQLTPRRARHTRRSAHRFLTHLTKSRKENTV